MSRWKSKEFIVSAAIIAVMLTALLLAVTLSKRSQPEQSSGISNSESSAKLNAAYLNYVRMNNSELRNEPNGNLLAWGYKICGDLHSFSELTLVNMVEVEYTGAGQRIYDGATQYLCEEGR